MRQTMFLFSALSLQSGRQRSLMATLLLMILAVVMIIFPSGAQEQRSAETGEVRERILVLHDGKILKGMITTLDMGYAIELNSSKVTVPFDMVICEASSLTEAYLKQREAMTKPTAEQHTRLASWCVQQKLFAEAERELESALKLQPQHQQARRMIEQLENRKPRDRDFVDQDLKKQIEKIIIQQEFGNVRPVGGLSPDLAQEFSTRIEPMLLNSCSNSSCHSTSSGNTFQLSRRWNTHGIHRHLTSLNLQAVTEQIDFTRPENSPLLTAIQGPHGPRKVDVFPGSRGKEHRQVLEQWTHRVAKFLGPTANPLPEGKIQQAGYEAPVEQKPSTPAITMPGKNTPRQPAAFVLTSDEAAAIPKMEENKRVEEVRREQAYDPFDPALFNLRKHGQKK